jgi:O-antigen/teichoic acid export membrane protein
MRFAFSIKLDGHVHEILSKGAIAFILKIMGAGLAFLFHMAIARYLGASGSGVYFLSLTIITFVATVTRLGMDNSVTRFVSAYASEHEWVKVKGVVRYALLITLVLALIISVALFYSADWLASTVFDMAELAIPLQLMSLVITPLALMTLYAKALQGLKRVRDAMLMQSVLTPLLACVALYYLAPLYGNTGAVSAYGIGVVITLIFGFCQWQRAKSAWKQIRAAFSAKQLLASSLPLLGAEVLKQVMQALPLILLGVWGSSADVGLFGVAQRTASLVSLVLIAANIIVAPKLAELYQQKNMLAVGRIARHGSLLMTAMAAPALLLFLIVPQWVMSLFGTEFVVGWQLLVIMALGQLINVMTGSVGFLLMMTGNERSYLSANMIAALLCVILACALIPLYGGLGAAVAAAVPLAIVNLIRVRYVWRSMGIMTLPWL